MFIGRKFFTLLAVFAMLDFAVLASLPNEQVDPLHILTQVLLAIEEREKLTLPDKPVVVTDLSSGEFSALLDSDSTSSISKQDMGSYYLVPGEAIADNGATTRRTLLVPKELFHEPSLENAPAHFLLNSKEHPVPIYKLESKDKAAETVLVLAKAFEEGAFYTPKNEEPCREWSPVLREAYGITSTPMLGKDGSSIEPSGDDIENYKIDAELSSSGIDQSKPSGIIRRNNLFTYSTKGDSWVDSLCVVEMPIEEYSELTYFRKNLMSDEGLDKLCELGYDDISKEDFFARCKILKEMGCKIGPKFMRFGLLNVGEGNVIAPLPLAIFRLMCGVDEITRARRELLMVIDESKFDYKTYGFRKFVGCIVQ